MTVHIQSPFEWAWDRLKASVSGIGSTRPDEYWPQANLHPGVPVVRRIGVADLRVALARGFDDFGANRDDVIFLCVIYPVIGLVLLLGFLALRRGVNVSLDEVASTFSQHFGLLFVPAAVGVVMFWPHLKAHAVAIAAALVVSVVLTIAVTALVAKALSPRK